MFPMSSDLVIEKKLNKFLVSIDLFATDVMPLMRLSIIGKRKASYDLIFNADESYAKAKRAAKADGIFVKSLGGNRFKLYAVIDLEGGMTGVELKIYPAASEDFPGYTEKAVGSVTINSIRTLMTH